MSFALNLRRDKSKIAYDGDPPKDNAVEQILAWAIDHLTPEEIENLITGLRENQETAPEIEPGPDQIPRNALAGDKARKTSTASFLRRFPEAARIGHVGGMGNDSPAPTAETNSFLTRFPEASRIALSTPYKR